LKVLQIDGEGRIVGEYKNPTEAAERTDLDVSHIIKVLKGKRSTHGGYRWKYEDGDIGGEFKEKRSSDYRNDTAILSAKTEKSITSEQEALEFFEVDLDRWEVDRLLVNSWDVSMKRKDGSSFKRTNYQVKLWLKKKETELGELLIDIGEKLSKYTPKPLTYTKGSSTIVVGLADFHIGAEIKNLLRTPDFNIDVLMDYMRGVSDIVNSYNAENVILNLHGDYVETITGLNHMDVWKSIGDDMYGANVLILANEMIGQYLISRIKNVREINIVSGNHDRVSMSRAVDSKGEGAKLLAWMLQKDFPNIPINYDDLIIVREIDGINHIMTHGHHGISKRDTSKVVADYGDSSKFNLWTEGHIHTRQYNKTYKHKLGKYENIEFVTLDEMNYRKLRLPPLFTGNFFSESLGYAGWAGFIISENNGKGIPNIYDYTL
jgi:predicted phosphodiesterase